MAMRVWTELQQGYAGDDPHIASFVADMSCAAEHLFRKQPELAEAIRADRIKVFDELLENPGVAPKHEPAFFEYLEAVLGLIRFEIKQEKDHLDDTQSIE